MTRSRQDSRRIGTHHVPLRRVIAALLGMTALVSGAAVSFVGSSAAVAAEFSVSGTRIVDPQGQEFVPVGANFEGPHSVWPRETLGKSSVARNAWRFNTIRLRTCLPGGCNHTRPWDWPTNNDLDAIVNEYSSAGIVVMIALHQITPGYFPTPTELETIDGWWRNTATRYQSNPYVWFNLLNEPGDTLPAPSEWLSVHQRLVNTVRATGARNIIVVDGSQWGQDAGSWNTNLVAEQNSAILTFGPQLVDPLRRTVFSFHAYGQWGMGSSSDDAARDRRMADYIDRVRAKGLALMIGETGGPADQSDASLVQATRTAYRVAPGRRLGILAWHAQPGDGFALTTGAQGDFDAINSWTSPTNLTWSGQLLWQHSHSTPTLTTSPTTTTSKPVTTTTPRKVRRR